MGWLGRRERRVLVHEYVTGGGLAGQDLPDSWAIEGHAMRRAVAEDFAAVEGVSVVITLDDRFPDEPGPWEVVCVAEGQEEATLTRLARKADATLVIAPETDGLLFEREGWVRAARGHPLRCDPMAVISAADKAGLASILLRAGVRTVPCLHAWTGSIDVAIARRVNQTLIPCGVPLPEGWGTWHREPCGGELFPGIPATTRAERSLVRDSDRAFFVPQFPVVVKPIDGAGSLDTRLATDADALVAELRRRRPAPDWMEEDVPASEIAAHAAVARLRRSGIVLVQPYVPGQPMSASFLVDRWGRAHLVGVGRQHVEINGDQFHYRGGKVPAGSPALADEARRAIAAVPGLRGWVGVDFIREDDGRVAILEINPRLTTSFVGLRRLLSPGTLAGAMLDASFDPRRLDRLDLAAVVHAHAPLTFRADGSILGTEEAHP